MAAIVLLDPHKRDRFLHPASRNIKTYRLLHRTYHKNPVKRDMFAEYEAIAAWSTVTCCYSGIEQAMKCLLKMAGLYSKKLHKHHNIGKLFKELVPEEKKVIEVSYAKFQSLHYYIPIDNVDSFLDAIDAGYQAWRYFLIEGSEEGRWPPTTHAGAMLDIWSALTDIIQARVFTNHGLHCVDRRIFYYLNQKLTLGAWTRNSFSGNGKAEIGEMNRWKQSYNHAINAYVDLFYRNKKDELHLFEVSPTTLKVFLALVIIVKEEVKSKKSDEDICTFIGRAETGSIRWNPQTDLFENPTMKPDNV